MIGKLKGIVDSCNHDHIIIDVNGVGYLVFCSGKTIANITPGEAVTFLIETHVREDHIHLYGFCKSEEKTTFILLQSVKGVGTRMSLAILSALSPDEISYALATKDAVAFTRISGVGKKLAERIITELKDKYSSNFIQNIPINQVNSNISDANNILLDATLALVSLGINKGDAQSRVSLILAENKDISLNELIRKALKG